MKKKKAMASDDQFSSVDIVDDILSKLPEPIIHHILGLLPSTKDVVRTSVISKSWLESWLTFPVHEFTMEDFVPSLRFGYKDKAKSKQFIGFVDSTLKRFERQNEDGNGNRMKIFNLSTFEKIAHQHSTRWIGMALDNQVEHLTLRTFEDGSELRSLIPDRVLSAYWLKSLKLEGSTIYIPLTDYSYVDLPSLTSLRIKEANIFNKQLRKLLSGCPALEEIALLNCASMLQVDISDHPNLETLEVAIKDRTRAGPSAIRVWAPKLKSFCYRFINIGSENDILVEILNSPELKSLRIQDRNKTDEWLHKFIAQFPLIEDLTIDCCDALRNIRISNPFVEKICILQCYILEDVVIDCEKLTSFFLSTMGYLLPKPSIRMEMDNLPNDCKAKVTLDQYTNGECYLLMDASWYCKMKEFLSGPVTFKSLDIWVGTLMLDVDGDMNGEDVHKRLPHAACNIEKLTLHDNANRSYHSHILNGLLSACHPTTIELDVKSDYSFVKSVCEELGRRENNRKCCCKDDFKCWKHQLKEVKIEKIKGIKLEKDLDWDALFDLLPNLEDENDIYFKLMW